MLRPSPNHGTQRLPNDDDDDDDLDYVLMSFLYLDSVLVSFSVFKLCAHLFCVFRLGAHHLFPVLILCSFLSCI